MGLCRYFRNGARVFTAASVSLIPSYPLRRSLCNPAECPRMMTIQLPPAPAGVGASLKSHTWLEEVSVAGGDNISISPARTCTHTHVSYSSAPGAAVADDQLRRSGWCVTCHGEQASGLCGVGLSSRHLQPPMVSIAPAPLSSTLSSPPRTTGVRPRTVLRG